MTMQIMTVKYNNVLSESTSESQLRHEWYGLETRKLDNITDWNKHLYRHFSRYKTD